MVFVLHNSHIFIANSNMCNINTRYKDDLNNNKGKMYRNESIIIVLEYVIHAHTTVNS